MLIVGLGPHGESAASLEGLRLSEADADAARNRQFTVAVVLHTTKSDWAKQQLAGIVTTLGRYSAAVVEVVDCQFGIDAQIRALGRLVRERPDAIISLPIGNAAVAEAHGKVSRAGIKLILLDNASTGLLPGTDYVCVVSADNFGLGQIGAKLLSSNIPQDGEIGILAYGVDFFVTNERDIAFRKWMGSERPDVVIKLAKFPDIDQAASVVDDLLSTNPDLGGLFAVWDAPAIQALAALRARSRELPVTTIDLGYEVALELASGELIKGIGAQQPYDQGIVAATATVLSLVGRQLPPWIALRGLEVGPSNVIESYQVVWHSPAPPELIKARRTAAADRNGGG